VGAGIPSNFCSLHDLLISNQIKVGSKNKSIQRNSFLPLWQVAGIIKNMAAIPEKKSHF